MSVLLLLLLLFVTPCFFFTEDIVKSPVFSRILLGLLEAEQALLSLDSATAVGKISAFHHVDQVLTSQNASQKTRSF